MRRAATTPVITARCRFTHKMTTIPYRYCKTHTEANFARLRILVDSNLGCESKTSIVHVKTGDYFKFMVGDVESMVDTIVKQNFCAFRIFANNEEDIAVRLPLIMDIECYPPQTVYRTASSLDMTDILPYTGYFHSESLTAVDAKKVFIKGLEAIIESMHHFVKAHAPASVVNAFKGSEIIVDESCSDEDGGKLRYFFLYFFFISCALRLVVHRGKVTPVIIPR